MLQRRLWVLLLILVATIGLNFFDSTKFSAQRVVLATPVRKTAPSTTSRDERAAEIDLLSIRPRSLAQSSPTDMFTVRDWTPPPPAPSPASVLVEPPTAPPPPVAPPLPFQVIGKQLEGERWTVFLARQDRTYAVSAGDEIEGSYRVDNVAPPVMTITYLPLKQQQTLAVGAIQ